jgi:perosamine synthetase
MKKIPLYGVVKLPEIEDAALEVLRSGSIATGKYVEKFEAGISEIIGQPNVVSMVDMTSAIFLALYLAGVRKGDEVLTTSFACLSTNSAIAQSGAVAVWVDVSPYSVELDLNDLEKKISNKTKAVILYHVAGYPGPAKELAEICQKRGIALIEDCDNALFAVDNGVHVGSHGDYAVYSFYPTRQINTTEGGALVCREASDAVRAKKLRRFGIDFATFRTATGEINPESFIPEIGWAFSMNNLCAAIGCAQLPTAESRVIKTRENVAKLSQKISKNIGVHIVTAAPNVLPAYWVLLLLVENRDQVLARMQGHGVSVSGVHQRNDKYTGFKTTIIDDLPNTQYIQNHILGIPCGWWLEDQELHEITRALKQATSNTVKM